MAAMAAVQRLGTTRHTLPAANLALMFSYYAEAPGGGASELTLLDDEFVTSTRHAVRAAAVAAAAAKQHPSVQSETHGAGEDGCFVISGETSNDLKAAVARATERQLLGPARAAAAVPPTPAVVGAAGDLLAAASAYVASSAGDVGDRGPSLTTAWAAVGAAQVAAKRGNGQGPASASA